MVGNISIIENTAAAAWLHKWANIVSWRYMNVVMQSSNASLFSFFAMTVMCPACGRKRMLLYDVCCVCGDWWRMSTVHWVFAWTWNKDVTSLNVAGALRGSLSVEVRGQTAFFKSFIKISRFTVTDTVAFFSISSKCTLRKRREMKVHKHIHAGELTTPEQLLLQHRSNLSSRQWKHQKDKQYL